MTYNFNSIIWGFSLGGGGQKCIENKAIFFFFNIHPIFAQYLISKQQGFQYVII